MWFGSTIAVNITVVGSNQSRRNAEGMVDNSISGPLQRFARAEVAIGGSLQ